jgi:hypothetical protein
VSPLPSCSAISSSGALQQLHGELAAFRLHDVAQAGAFVFQLAPQSAQRHRQLLRDVPDRCDQALPIL